MTPPTPLPKNVKNFRSALTPAQVKAVRILIATGSQHEAAREVGVSDRTIREWLHLPGFVISLRVGQQRILESVALRVGGLLHESLDAIETALTDQDVKVRLRAAEVFLARGTVLIEFCVSEQRLQRIEKTLGFDEDKTT
jgi:hypothetical protein